MEEYSRGKSFYLFFILVPLQTFFHVLLGFLHKGLNMSPVAPVFYISI